MTIQIERPSAQIIQFPIRARGTVALKRETAVTPADAAASPIYEGGWYHEEAIQAERPLKN